MRVRPGSRCREDAHNACYGLNSHQPQAPSLRLRDGILDEDVAPLMVAADGSATNRTYPQPQAFEGGFCVLELPNREAAINWAAKIAKACRCAQELREFQYDPES